MGLHHCHHFGLGFQEGTMVFQIVHQRGQTHIQDGEMGFLLQLGNNLFKSEISGTFKQDGLVGEVHIRQLQKQRGSVGIG